MDDAERFVNELAEFEARSAPRERRHGAWAGLLRAVAAPLRRAARLFRRPPGDPHAYVMARRKPAPRSPRSSAAVLDPPD